MKLDMEVGLGPGDIMLDGDPAPRKKGTVAPTKLSAHVYCGHGRPSQLLLSSCYILEVTFDIFSWSMLTLPMSYTTLLLLLNNGIFDYIVAVVLCLSVLGDRF